MHLKENLALTYLSNLILDIAIFTSILNEVIGKYRRILIEIGLEELKWK